MRGERRKLAKFDGESTRPKTSVFRIVFVLPYLGKWKPNLPAQGGQIFSERSALRPYSKAGKRSCCVMSGICTEFSTDKIVGGREPADVRYGLQVPDDDVRFHARRHFAVTPGG